MEREPARWKQDNVQTLIKLIQDNPVIGIVKVGGIPGPQIQKMRRELQGKATLLVAKNNLLELALKEAAGKKKGVDELVENFDGQVAIVATDVNPFKLFKDMEATMTKAPAKGGELAPDEIYIKAGDTPFKPGPVVGDLQKAGIPAAIEQGKVVIKKDKVLVKEGEPIPVDVAKMLTRLEIFPLTVGMELSAAYEDGTIFGKDVLKVDEIEFMANLNFAISGTFNLATFIGHATPQTINPLIRKAHFDAMNLALNAGVVNSTTIETLLSLAQGKMLALASTVSYDLGDVDDEPKEEVSAEPSDDPSDEPASEPEPVSEPADEPEAEPATEPVTEPTSEPDAEEPAGEEKPAEDGKKDEKKGDAEEEKKEAEPKEEKAEEPKEEASTDEKPDEKKADDDKEITVKE